ncbi:hypothetical protein HN51_019280 [Arachis hypogaea]|uniref:Phytosulfokine n=1 Tax=Arachis duranensis TaxID=130453 RepID=A0A6P4BVQ4_ARADU|nr:phytosulfokines 5 isoform X1 [Arachis duranensis]XP_025614181.1 phytosulfokines 5 isoform X1 [Arachis hypogaea]XP_052112478.1 phytosulfokines 5-like isoform X1 [Arachis duranensis]
MIIMMKPTLHYGLFLLFFFLFFQVFSSKLEARPLITHQGENRILDGSSGESFVFQEGGESSKQLLGVEECNSGDEECLMRRMTLEAHIDYIYTQHHKP